MTLAFFIVCLIVVILLVIIYKMWQTKHTSIEKYKVEWQKMKSEKEKLEARIMKGNKRIKEIIKSEEIDNDSVHHILDNIVLG